jgi:CRP-like cAMP-binding protein
MIQQARRRTYSKDETITLYGNVWSYLFLVGEGKVEALKESSDGRSLHVTCFGKGELFWGLSFFHEDAPMPVTLQAREKSVLYLWTRILFCQSFSATDRSLGESAAFMEDRMRHASNLVEGLAFHLVAGRLARLCLIILKQRATRPSRVT